MKKLFLLLALAALMLPAFAQGDFSATTFSWTEASKLNVTGKVFQDTPNPYQRMDFDRFGGWTEKDITRLKMSAGVIVAFETDSPAIKVRTEWIKAADGNISGQASRGFDLYIKKDGKWLWAGVRALDMGEDPQEGMLVANMDESMKECMLYLPTHSTEKSVQIGIVEGYKIKPGKEPFRHRICLHGSSYMHGAYTTRSGATVPGYLSRLTGLMFCNLGVGGDCLMQPQFARALKDADVEAFVFDAFSNGSASSVKKNMFKFIEILQSGQKGKPLIFMSTIYRENRNFNTLADKNETEKDEMSRKMVAEAMKKYKDVYFIESNASDEWHESSADGVHPGDGGYLLWALSVKDQILEILAKYGIE
ncbi:MAG: SGNH/GDSL hydrolase family protein [Bacteroidales bacterium]|nr:SGNH/GDSL hydrolase family protein [Bacteroidales bacterium]